VVVCLFFIQIVTLCASPSTSVDITGASCTLLPLRYNFMTPSVVLLWKVLPPGVVTGFTIFGTWEALNQ